MTPDLDAFNAALRLIREAEACRLTAYRDPVGVWTCGWGSTGPDIGFGTEWTQTRADAELQSRAVGAYNDASYAVGLPWEGLTSARRAALVDMAYNLGRIRLLGFHQMLLAVQHSDWPEARRQGMASKWATQVHGRAKRDTGIILTGLLPWEKADGPTT